MQLLLLFSIGLLALFSLSESYLYQTPNYVEKWTNVFSDDSVLRVLPADKAKKRGSSLETPTHDDADFVKQRVFKDRKWALTNCFTEVIKTGKYDDLDLLLTTATKCVIRLTDNSVNKLTMEGKLKGYLDDAHYAKYSIKADFGTEDRNPVSSTFKQISDSNDVTIRFSNKLYKNKLNGKIIYTRGKVNGVMTSKTTTKTNLVSAHLRVNCKMDYEEETTNTNTTSNQDTVDRTDADEVLIELAPNKNSRVSIQPRSRIVTEKVVQPVLLSGFIGVITDKNQKWYVPVKELSKYFPTHFRPAKDEQIQVLVTDFQTSSSFFFYQKST